MNIPALSSHPGVTASDLRPHAPELTAQERARAVHLRGAALRRAPAAEQGAAVASQFEAVLVRQLLGPTLSSMLGRGGGVAGNVYGDLLTDTFAQQLTAGGGLGIGRLLEKQITPQAANPVRPPNPLPT